MTGRLSPAHFVPRLRAVPPGRLRLLFVLALLAVLAVSAARYAAKAGKPSELGTLTRTAFLRWRPQVLELDRGTDIYRAFAYPNPPVMALVLRPFYELPPLPGALLWFGLKAGMAAAAAVWAFRLVRPPGGAAAAAVVLALPPVLGDLSHGNVNLFIGFLVAGALELFRRRRDFPAGVVLALAIACKVTPALFVPYFVWKRSWRLLAGVAVGLGLWLAVVPSAVLGWERNQTLLASWFDVMVRPFVLDGKVTTEHPNQSVPGLTFRLLTREPSFVDYDDDDRPFAAEFHNLADIGPDAARWVVKGCMAAFALAVVTCCRTPTHRPGGARDGPRLAAEFGLIALGMLLFSERTWKHHAVTLILPLAVLAAAAADRRWWAAGLLAVAAVLTVGPTLLSGADQDLAMVYGSYTVAYAVLAVGCAAAARCGSDLEHVRGG